jgi:hypothetical protein
VGAGCHAADSRKNRVERRKKEESGNKVEALRSIQADCGDAPIIRATKQCDCAALPLP